MASRILSRFLPNADSALYDAQDPIADRRLERGFGQVEHDQPRDSSDDHELDALLTQAAHSEMPEESQQLSPTHPVNLASPNAARPRWMQNNATQAAEPEDDVPQSLLLEGRSEQHTYQQPPNRGAPADRTAVSCTAEQWRKAQDRQPLYLDRDVPQAAGARGNHRVTRATIDAKEQAMWRWTNVQNLDAFLLDVYEYYINHGIWSILLTRTIRLLYVDRPSETAGRRVANI